MHAEDRDGQRALHHAAKLGGLAVAELLLAAKGGRASVLALVAAGGEVKPGDPHYQGVLRSAIQARREEVTAQLRAVGANPHARTT